ncbi:MAG: ATP synthase F0 subunit B [Nitrospinae bacterium]|nr:ATP synthase F0 subunit B [Nitrospinota bacterium]
MINIDGTIVMQMVNFLVLLALMNVLLFKPTLAAFEERQRRLAELERGGKGAADEGDTLAARYEQALVDIRHESAEIIAQARVGAAQETAALMAAAREEFNGKVAVARAAIADDVNNASAQLTRDSEGFAATLAAKLLGRKV